MKARYRVGVLAMVAALATLMAAPVTTASAEGICVCGMKRPLRADGLHHLKKPLVARGMLHIDASNIWHRPL